MTNQDWKKLQRMIGTAVTRGVFQGVICLALFAFILIAGWHFLRIGFPMFLEWLGTF